MNKELFLISFFDGDITFTSPEECESLFSSTVKLLEEKGFGVADDNTIYREKNEFDFADDDIEVDGKEMHRLTEEESDDLAHEIMSLLSVGDDLVEE